MPSCSHKSNLLLLGSTSSCSSIICVAKQQRFIRFFIHSETTLLAVLEPTMPVTAEQSVPTPVFVSMLLRDRFLPIQSSYCAWEEELHFLT